MNLLSRVSLGLIGLSFGLSLACQMGNPAFDLGDSQADAGETRASGDGDLSTSAEGNTSVGDGDGDPTTGDGDPTTGDGDPTTSGDGDGDPTTSNDGDGDPTTGDGDPTSGDGDGEPGVCGDALVDPGEDCDDGNTNDGDGCEGDCTLFDPDPNGDGDGDGGMQMCAQIINPMTCADCLHGFCCTPDQLACSESMACMCMLVCMDAGGGEIACAQQCMAEQMLVIPLATATIGCAQQNCNLQCFGG